MPIAALVDSLHAFYGPLPSPPKDLFQFFVWEVLSRDVQPPRRDLAWQALLRIPALTPDAMFRAAPKKFADAVGLIGSARDDRIEVLRTGVGDFRRHRDLEARVEKPRSMLDAMRALRRIAPLDRQARQRALLFVAGFKLMPVDRGIARVAARLGLAPSDRGRDVRRALAGLLPADVPAYRQTTIYLLHHASHACLPVAPHCGVCPLRAGCPAAR